MNLFTYGTLMFPEVWERIAIGEFPAQKGTLAGYSVYRVRDALYPGIILSDNGAIVSGKIYQGLDDDTLYELDTYESSFYERIIVQARTAEGASLDCYAYVVPQSRRDLLTDEPWDAEHFSQNLLHAYLNGEISNALE